MGAHRWNWALGGCLALRRLLVKMLSPCVPGLGSLHTAHTYWRQLLRQFLRARPKLQYGGDTGTDGAQLLCAYLRGPHQIHASHSPCGP